MNDRREVKSIKNRERHHYLNAPMQGGFLRRLTIDGKPLDQGQQAPNVTMLTIDPRYFKTIGLPLQRGRDLTDEDGMTGREATVVNQRFVALHFPNEDPLGRRITLAIDLQGGAPPQGGIPVSLTATIVGIVPNLLQLISSSDPDPIAKMPFRTIRAASELDRRAPASELMTNPSREAARSIRIAVVLHRTWTPPWPRREAVRILERVRIFRSSAGAVGRGRYRLTAYACRTHAEISC